VPDAFHDGRVDFTRAQDKGPQVCPALTNILEMLAGRLAVRTADDRRSLLQGE
jgi:hypothetical protein